MKLLPRKETKNQLLEWKGFEVQTRKNFKSFFCEPKKKFWTKKSYDKVFIESKNKQSKQKNENLDCRRRYQNWMTKHFLQWGKKCLKKSKKECCNWKIWKKNNQNLPNFHLWKKSVKSSGVSLRLVIDMPLVDSGEKQKYQLEHENFSCSENKNSQKVKDKCLVE